MKWNSFHTVLKNDLNVNLYSKYRSTLMGIAIFGVLSGHFFSLSEIEPINFILLLISNIYILVFTQGFLFLSGFGIYFSYSKNPNIFNFYKRRLYRLFLPYVILTTPYFIFQDFFFEEPDLLKFVGHITTFGYWTEEGNFNGLWYIAISIILYIVYPFIHKVVFFKKNNLSIVTLSWITLMALVSIINVFIINSYPEFYSAHNLGIDQYSIFFVGMYTGYLLQRKDVTCQLLLLLFFVVAFVLQRIIPELNFLYEPMKKVCIYMPLICVFFYFLEHRLKIIHWLKITLDWMGAYSLELYILQSIVYCFLMRLQLDFVDSFVSISVAIFLSLILCKPLHILIDKIKNTN